MLSRWRHHLIRVGALGHVGRCPAVDATGYPRGVRDCGAHGAKGLGLGEECSARRPMLPPAAGGMGRSCARLTIEDQLLEARFQAESARSVHGLCRLVGRAPGLATTLVDVEQVFDGRRLFFYCSGEPPAGKSRRSRSSWPKSTTRPPKSAALPPRSPKAADPAAAPAKRKGAASGSCSRAVRWRGLAAQKSGGRSHG